MFILSFSFSSKFLNICYCFYLFSWDSFLFFCFTCLLFFFFCFWYFLVTIFAHHILNDLINFIQILLFQLKYFFLLCDFLTFLLWTLYFLRIPHYLLIFLVFFLSNHLFDLAFQILIPLLRIIFISHFVYQIFLLADLTVH